MTPGSQDQDVGQVLHLLAMKNTLWPGPTLCGYWGRQLHEHKKGTVVTAAVTAVGAGAVAVRRKDQNEI